jgi:hypothetical protein
MGQDRKTNLYHCTKADSLIKILESKYYLYSYCLENYYERIGLKYSLMKRAYAMVCFADMYPYELPAHMKQFGSDAYLMMDKKWAEDKRVSPVLYYNKNSFSNWAFLSINNRQIELSAIQDNEGIVAISDLLEKSIEIFRPFFKQYEGKYYLHGTENESKESIEFFLEREWRSFPFVENNEHLYLNVDDYKDPNTRSKYQKELFDRGYYLGFQWDDIIEIGCRRRVIPALVQTIQTSYGVDKRTARKKIKIVHPYTRFYSWLLKIIFP